MNIYITLDYELFFGAASGSTEHCMIRPTNALHDITDNFGVKFSCFVDTGYLLALEKKKEEYAQLREDYVKVTRQIRSLSEQGHGMELHVHPHWEDSYYNGDKWVFNTSRYKLADFDEHQVQDIVTRHTEILKNISGKDPVAYRAGGWSAQPFEAIGRALSKNHIFIDSSVYPGGLYQSSNQVFDFTGVPPYKTYYRFSEDLVQENPKGIFTEIPIAAQRVSPTFFWRFALNKILKMKKHRAFGDGQAIALSNSGLWEKLTRSSISVVSIDGYKSKYLMEAFKNYEHKTNNEGNFVIIGHPKAFTPYSLKKIRAFVSKTHLKNEYKIFQ